MRGLIVVALAGFVCAAFGAPITTGTLIDEMIDMHRLAQFPAPPYKTIQFSSYDHRSALPGGPNWFANADGFGGEPTPNVESVIKAPEGNADGEYLLCDIPGAGAIVRLWSADIAGKIRLYLDGAEAPIYDGPAKDFFLHPYDAFLGDSGIAPETLAGTFYQRNAAYAPIPFAKQCKIVWVGNHKQIHFYEIQVRKYPDGTEVTTFTPAELKANAEKIKNVTAIFNDIDNKWPYRSQKPAVPISVNAPAHKVTEALKLEGAGAIERLTLRLNAPNIDAALRQTILHIQFDKAPWGQVQAPVGDFFGAAPGINPYTSVPFSVAPDGAMTCRFVMPYKESVHILFDNRGDQNVEITGSALPIDYAWDDAASMHFRALWRVNHGMVAFGADNMGVQDLPFLLARGQGVWVGTAVMMMNPSPVPASGGSWWGEGDEKIFVDDDVRPSIFGTGSEDYFNYAWSAADIFLHPYCGQPRNDGPANRGFVANYRWHILDPLPFSRNMAFYMELFSHERVPDFSYARIGYHYAKPGIVDDHVPMTDEDVRVLRLQPWEPQPRGAVTGFVFCPCENLIKKSGDIKFEEDNMWQGGKVLVWTPKNEGEELRLTFTVPADAKYEIQMACMLRSDGGSFVASVDGKEVPFDGKPLVDLSAPYRVLSRMIGAPPAPYKPGKHVMVLKAAESGKPVGLDFFGLRKR